MKNFVKLLTAMAILILIYTAVCFYLAGDQSPAEIPEFCPTNTSSQAMVLNQWKHASQYTVMDYTRG